jgi:hypothetical protein
MRNPFARDGKTISVTTMTSAVEYYPDTIITKSRGILEYLSLGNWGRICALHFNQNVLEETTFRFIRRKTQKYHLHMFDAVDFSYKLLATASNYGVEQDSEEFRVGLRFSSTGKVFPLAIFRGTATSYSGLASLFPASWTSHDHSHELAARSLANILCQKMQLLLADY